MVLKLVGVKLWRDEGRTMTNNRTLLPVGRGKGTLNRLYVVFRRHLLINFLFASCLAELGETDQPTIHGESPSHFRQPITPTIAASHRAALLKGVGKPLRHALGHCTARDSLRLS
jgi:hypothetical protein